MFDTIVKRDGRSVPYDIEKIATAISKAMAASGRRDEGQSLTLAQDCEARLAQRFPDSPPGVEDIQDMVETVLMDNGYAFVAKKYILYRKHWQ